MLKLPTIIFLIAFFIMATLHVLAIELYLYWKHLWLDIPMHMLGGSVIALGMFAAHDLLRSFPKRLLYPIPVLLVVLMGSLAWEVFEIYAGVPIEANFAGDTTIDLVMDMLGGIVGYIVGYSLSSLDIDEEVA